MLTIPVIKKKREYNDDEMSLLLEKEGLKLPIMHAEWPEVFPYVPTTSVSLLHDAQAIYLLYNCYTHALECRAMHDGDDVYQDCCLEAFLQLPNDNRYFNFEFNAVGVCDAAYRSGRSDAKPFVEEQYETILRKSTVSRADISKGDEARFFSLYVKIPFKTMGLDKAPDSLFANFYKCGDETVTPHYCSWNPVKTANPDFHQPKFFKELRLEH